MTEDDLRAVIAALVAQAKAGDLAAIRELLDRLLGKPLAGLAVVSAELAAEPIDESRTVEQRRARLLAIMARLAERQQGNGQTADPGGGAAEADDQYCQPIEFDLVASEGQ